MLLTDFIAGYATDMGVTVTSSNGEKFPVYMVSIAGIMSTIESCDSYEEHEDFEQSWSEIFYEKRQDSGYEELVDSIRNHGILTPFCILTGDDADDYEVVDSFHNGNHRLAAAVELGYTHAPIVFVHRDRDHYSLRWDLTQLGGYDGGSEWGCACCGHEFDTDEEAKEVRAELITKATIPPVLMPA